MAIEQIISSIREQVAKMPTESKKSMAESMRNAHLFFDLIADPDIINTLLNTSDALNPVIPLGNYQRGDQNRVEAINLVINTMTRIRKGDELTSIIPIEPYLLAVVTYAYDDLQTSVESREGYQTDMLTKIYLEKTSPDYAWSIENPDKSYEKNASYEPRAYYIGKRALTPELLAGAHGQNITRMAETIKKLLPDKKKEE